MRQNNSITNLNFEQNMSYAEEEEGTATGNNNNDGSEDDSQSLANNDSSMIVGDDDKTNEKKNTKLKQAFMVMDSLAELAGEIALDVVTGGIYGITVGTVEATEGLAEASKEKKEKGEKLSFEDQCDIVGDAFTGGLYTGKVFDELGFGNDQEDENTNEKQKTNKDITNNITQHR